MKRHNAIGHLDLAVFKKIRLREQNRDLANRISETYRLSSVAARVLSARGFQDDDKLRHFISPTLKEGLPDPGCLRGLKEGIALVSEVISNGGSVAICCDFDVDGLSGGAQVHHFFTAIGVRSKVFVPDRFTDGYGLNEKMVRQIAAEGFNLVITVDYGTTNHAELKVARELGLKSMVLDHHHVVKAPPADVFINPNQENCGFADKVLCASGLAWYFLLGLRKGLQKAAEIDVKNYLDLACLGTICDMVPLIGANRIIARRGLEMLDRTERAGLVALKKVMGLKGTISCSDISFGLGPRLNAAGRMIHGELVIELLTTTDKARAESLARDLHRLNAERQDTEALVKDSAVKKIREMGFVPPGIVVWDPTFHTGVIGIVAQRLVETFYRPAIVMGADGEGIFKGSVRGIKDFSVVESLAAVSEHLIKFGGHDGAGGFSVKAENVEQFAKAYVSFCEAKLSGLNTQPYVDADTEVELGEISLALVDELRKFAPFGIGNPGPTLCVRGLTVKDIRVLKGSHLKVILSDQKRSIAGLMWKYTSHPDLESGARVDIACRPDKNSFNGNLELQATIQAVEKSA